jgi:hypothetical protein
MHVPMVMIWVLTFVPPDDILNVRLQTLGVVEHSFDIGLGGSCYNWKMYDVGGAVRVSYIFVILNSLVAFREGRQVSDSSRPPLIFF